jgi:hypothetical protein
MILLASLIAAGLYLAHRSTLSSNKGHRVQRNSKSVVAVTSKGSIHGIYDEVLDEAPFPRTYKKTWNSISVTVPTSDLSEFMSDLRERFHEDVAAGRLSIRVNRNLRGRGVEKGNRGRQR